MQSEVSPGIVGTAHGFELLGSGFQHRPLGRAGAISAAPTAGTAPATKIINSGKVRFAVRRSGHLFLCNLRSCGAVRSRSCACNIHGHGASQHLIVGPAHSEGIGGSPRRSQLTNSTRGYASEARVDGGSRGVLYRPGKSHGLAGLNRSRFGFEIHNARRKLASPLVRRSGRGSRLRRRSRLWRRRLRDQRTGRQRDHCQGLEGFHRECHPFASTLIQFI